MNHKILVGLVASIVTTGAFAQSNVTVYGVIDTALRYTTNNNAAGDNKVSLGEGIFQGPRIGFKGEEDLGGGMAAVFKLENGFVSTTGAIDQQGQLFGRQAFIGLKDKSLGEVDFGRQYGLAFDTLGNYDPLGIGNAPENEWEIFLYGVRFDNSIRYTNTWGPVKAVVQYSPGGQAGAPSIGATDAGSLTYTNGPFSIGGLVSQSTDAKSNQLTVAGLGATYVAGPATLYLNYFGAKRDAGFAKAANLSGGALANTSLLGNAGNTLQRTDDVWTTGVVFQATPTLAYTVGYMTDSVKNESSLGDTGRISTLYAVVDYNLSKRTDVYFDIDHNNLSGGEITDANSISNDLGSFGGNSNRTGVAAGLRVKF